MRNFHKIILTFFTLVFALSINGAYAQDAVQPAKKTSAFVPYFYGNANAGITNFWSDYNTNNSTTEIGGKLDLFHRTFFGGGFNFGYQFSPIFGGRLNITSGQLRSDPPDQSYRSNFNDYSGQVTIDITNIFRDNYDSKFSFYGFGGVGLLAMKADIYGLPLNYSCCDKTDFKTKTLVFPAGFGLKYALNNYFDLTFETSLHYTATDELEYIGTDSKIHQMDGFRYSSLGLTYKVLDGFGTSPRITNGLFAPYYYANVDFGVNHILSDIPSDSWLGSQEMFGWGLKAGYQFDPIFGVRVGAYTGELASKADRTTPAIPNLIYYKGVFVDLYSQLTVDITNIFREDKDAAFSILGFGGVGVSTHNYNKYLTSSGNYYGPQNVRNNVMMFPFGLGARLGVTEKVDLTLESNMRFTARFTDDDQLEGITGGNMMFVNDRYLTTTLGLTYRMGDLFGNINKMIRDHGTVVYKVTPEVLQERGGKVPYEVSVTFPPNYFLRNAAVNVAPVLKYGDKELALASHSFYGEKVTAGKGQMVPYATGGTYTFKGVFDFVPEMAAANVEVNPVVYVPKAGVEPEFKNLAAAQFKIGDGVIHTEDLAGGNEGKLLAAHGYELENIITNGAKLYFPKNLYTYKDNFGINKTAAATDARTNLNTCLSKGLAIKDIVVNAYASPEGEETFNANLSSNRAKVGESYLRAEFQKLVKAKDSKITIKDLKSLPFKVVGNGPDWDGFMSALDKSSLAEKGTILNVVKSAPAVKKEEEIRNMILIYPELENLLSTLRRAEISVNMFETKRSTAQIAELATTKPADLSVQELLYAATLTEDLKAQTSIYKSAANLYANSWEAQANYGFVETLNGDYVNALKLFEKANTLSPNNAVVLNNMGVVFAKKGDWTKAKKFFTDAQKLGSNENYNLGVAAIQFGEYEKALELFGSKKCDVNVGLAQLLLGKYADAKANLKCAEETCKTNYLLAVVGARTSNDAEVFAGLKKAFEINPKLKGMALNDREFVRYFNNAEFIALVK
jgi:Flp pilus assembly protein TadD